MDAHVVDQLVEWVRGRYFGKYRGTVISNTETPQRGRLKVRVPAVLGDLEVWAMPCVPYAGPSVGFYSLPPNKSAVWVEFEGGDPSYPIWTGCFWADGENPNTTGPDVKMWKTDKITVRIDDKAEEAKIELTSGAKLTMAADVVTECGGAKHAVGSAGVVSNKGSTKMEVAGTFKVNGGALEVT